MDSVTVGGTVIVPDLVLEVTITAEHHLARAMAGTVLAMMVPDTAVDTPPTTMTVTATELGMLIFEEMVTEIH